MTETITVDYLVVGAGAMGMAFVDTLLSDTKATIAIVDRYARPGGHWNVAYPFVRLHQPSAFYGVNSKALGEGKIDQVGLNKGLAELATGDEVCAYFDKVMNQTFLPSRRVKYFPKHVYTGDGEFVSILTNKTYRVAENAKIVDATYMKVRVPAMGPPTYKVEDVSLITPNELPLISRPWGSYTVVGAGKTGIDACLWLLANGVEPDSISWIMPRDSWYMERGRLQPRYAPERKKGPGLEEDFAPFVLATSPEDVFLRQEKAGSLTRLDENVWPTMFRCATISYAELEQIRKIKNIIRKGRIIRLGSNEIVLEQGTLKPAQDTLYIDCTADGLAKLPPVPVFQGKNITLQSVRYCQQVFSAAFVGHIEAAYDDEDSKNKMCTVVPHPDDTMDYLSVSRQTFMNEMQWAAQPTTRAWLADARLNWIGKLFEQSPDDTGSVKEHLAKMGAGLMGVCGKLEQLMAMNNEGVPAEKAEGS